MKSYLLITLIIASKICNADIKIIKNPNNKWNLFDDKLKTKIGLSYSYIDKESFYYSNSIIAIADLSHNSTGIINNKGVFIIPATLDAQYTINYDKKIIYQKKNNKLYLYNYSGILLHKIENLNFALIAPNVSNDLLLTHISNPDYSTEIIFINQNGQIAIQKNIIEQFNNKYIYNSFIKNTFPLMLKDERSAIIDNMGNYLIQPDNNKIAYITNTNYYIIKKNNDNCYLYNINDGKITQTDYSDFSVPMNEQFNNTIALKKSISNTYDLYRYDNAFNLTMKFSNINVDTRYPKNETISFDQIYELIDSNFISFNKFKENGMLIKDCYSCDYKFECYILSTGDKKILVDRNLNLIVDGVFNNIESYKSVYNKPYTSNIIFLKNDSCTIAYDFKNQTEVGKFKFINPKPEIISESKLKFICGDEVSTYSVVFKNSEWIREYSENSDIEFIPYTENNKWGLKTKDNIVILKPIAKSIQLFKYVYILNFDKYYRIYNKQLEPISDLFTDYGELRIENGYANHNNGAIILTNKGTKIDSVLSNGVLSIGYSTFEKNGFFQNGKQYLKCQYDEISKMPNGNFIIIDNYRDKNTGDFGFISYILDSNGSQITQKTKGRLTLGSNNEFNLNLQNGKILSFTTISGIKTHCKNNNIEAEKQNIATAQNNTNQSIASPEAEQKKIQEAKKKIQFKYVSNSNSTCKYCSKTIHCKKKTQSDINYDKEIMTISMPLIIEMNKCLPIMILFGSKEDQKINTEQLNGIFRISLYDCPTYCSIKCQDDCEKSNNCR